MRKPRIELGPTAWKAAILTIILFALLADRVVHTNLITCIPQFLCSSVIRLELCFFPWINIVPVLILTEFNLDIISYSGPMV